MSADPISFAGRVWHWRGPSPFHFVTVPPAACDTLADLAAEVSYGWGMVPVRVTIGTTTWATSLFPKDGGYVLPIRDSTRRREGIELEDTVEVAMVVALRKPIR